MLYAGYICIQQHYTSSIFIHICSTIHNISCLTLLKWTLYYFYFNGCVYVFTAHGFFLLLISNSMAIQFFSPFGRYFVFSLPIREHTHYFCCWIFFFSHLFFVFAARSNLVHSLISNIWWSENQSERERTADSVWNENEIYYSL